LLQHAASGRDRVSAADGCRTPKSADDGLKPIQKGR
jgi:hypothetical protein